MSKNVLYLSPYFWPEQIGSAPYCTELAVHLAQSGYRLRTVAFRPHYPSPEPFIAWNEGSRDQEMFNDIAISRVVVSARKSGGFKERLRNDLRFLGVVILKAFAGRFKEMDVVVAYVPSVLTVLGAAVVKMLSGTKVVTIVHDIESGLARSLGIVKSPVLLRMMRFVEQLALNRSDKIVVLTEGMKRELESMGCIRSISVISIWASPAPDSAGLTGRPILMYSGNFGKKQNLDQLIPLIKRLSDKRSDIKVVMQGDGSEKERIVKALEKESVGNTTFVPLVELDKLVSSLQSATLHIVPQAIDVANYALPSKLFSIMAAGRPFVCIAEPGSPLDLLTQRSNAGVSVRPGDEDELFRSVTSLMDDEAELLSKGDSGRKFVAECMNKGQIMAQYVSLIDNAVSSI